MKRILLALTLCSSLLAYSQTQVTFYTNFGNFEAQLHDSVMPITAGNFKSLVDSAFYDSVIFHRIISSFVIQGGDPTGTGYGGPGYTIPDEFVTGISNVKKTLSMANAGPNTGGSQFFINLKNNTFLDFDKSPFSSAHPVFGFVTTGWSVVEAIELTPVDGNDRPISPVIMDSVRVTGSVLSQEEIEANLYTTQVYPNPATAESILDFYTHTPETIVITAIDANGRIVHKSTLESNAGKNKIALRDFGLFNWQAGIYTLSLKSKTNIQNVKVNVIR
ncbi:MAG: peptidylprolyl isomerase [Schleiferiaceae bacterium]|jgi:peptidylprolyl isomerase|nr:peptidylprolyl isomerase [Schleiferiaceae bacterium]